LAKAIINRKGNSDDFDATRTHAGQSVVSMVAEAEKLAKAWPHKQQKGGD
jgi:hypothetical protein